jgi:hypothetical protein
MLLWQARESPQARPVGTEPVRQAAQLQGQPFAPLPGFVQEQVGLVVARERLALELGLMQLVQLQAGIFLHKNHAHLWAELD